MLKFKGISSLALTTFILYAAPGLALLAVATESIVVLNADTSFAYDVCRAFNGKPSSKESSEYATCTLNKINHTRINTGIIKDSLTDSESYAATICASRNGTLVRSHNKSVYFNICLKEGK